MNSIQFVKIIFFIMTNPSENRHLIIHRELKSKKRKPTRTNAIKQSYASEKLPNETNNPPITIKAPPAITIKLGMDLKVR